ncbi:MAG TPA: hypothetical protein VLC46_01625 [Thermoanaerobaculia bacterium]|jgi:hypothetical protein|nr:hypothetical protein [Thermoanaerobaculia bacterium]
MDPRNEVASANRNRARISFPIVSFLWFLGIAAAPSASFSQPSPPPVTSFRVYRAIDSRFLGGSLGDAGTRLGNTNAASAGGVLGYLHTEVIPSFAVSKTGLRHNNIDAIAVFEVHVLNVRRARLIAPNDPPGNMNLFGPFMAFDRGMAMPPPAREQIMSYGAYVGIQDQANNPRHAYPGDWYSFVGVCPLSPWTTGENGYGDKPSPCPTTPALEGICPAAGAAPDGTPLCQYTYSYLGYVPLDDLVGITSKAHPLCQEGGTPRACVDYADFRRNGGIEYSAGPNDAVECAGEKGPESGLPFWRGRCDPEKALARIRALTSWSPLVVPKRPAR